MRVLFFMPSLTLGKGGAEAVCANVANYLVLAGQDVAIVMDQRRGREPLYELNDQVTRIYFDWSNFDQDQLIKDMKHFNPDCAFYFYFNSDIMKYMPLLRSLNVPIGIQECCSPFRAVRNISKDKLVKSPEQAFWLRQVYLSQANVVRLTMDSYVSSLPFMKPQEIFAFKNAFNLNTLSTLKSPSQRRRIINVGGLKAPNKNGAALYDAFRRISRLHPDVDLHYYGKNNRKDLITSAKRDKLENRVFFHGMTENMYDEYIKGYIHVICSYEEGCPNVVCEAMSNGIPSIGYEDCSGTNEIIRHNENGLLIPRGKNGLSLSQAISNLLLDKDKRDRLGLVAYNDAKETFDHNKIYAKWFELFNFLADQKIKKTVTHKRGRQSAFLKRFNAETTRAAQDRINENIKFSKTPYVSYGKHKTNPLVSIIVTLFNKQDDIVDTIESILQCDYNNKEIIVINDKSTDNSVKNIESYIKNKSVILINHRTNQGLSAARNTGLQHAKGDYIQFWDGDDKYHPTGLKNIIMEMEEDGSDIGTGVATRDGGILKHYKKSAIERRRVKYSDLPKILYTTSTCFKIYAHDFLKRNSLLFVNKLYVQDLEFNIRAFRCASSITVTPYIIGEYQFFPNSGGKQINIPRLESSLKIHHLVEQDIQKLSNPNVILHSRLKVIEFSFVFFLRHLLKYYIEDSYENGTDMTHDTVIEYLDKYAACLQSYGLATKELFHRIPHQGRMLLAVSAKEYELAFKFLRKKHIPLECCVKLTKNNMSIAMPDIRRMLSNQ